MNEAVGTKQASIDLPAKRLGKLTARVEVVKTETAATGEPADTPIPPLPIGTLGKPEREASGATNPRAPAEAARESPNPWLRAWDDLFGGWAFSARQSIDFAAVGSTGWAVQLGAARSEAKAKPDLKRLNADMGPRSGDRQSAFARSSLVARPSTDCASSAYREMKPRRFAHG